MNTLNGDDVFLLACGEFAWSFANTLDKGFSTPVSTEIRAALDALEDSVLDDGVPFEVAKLRVDELAASIDPFSMDAPAPWPVGLLEEACLAQVVYAARYLAGEVAAKGWAADALEELLAELYAASVEERPRASGADVDEASAAMSDAVARLSEFVRESDWAACRDLAAAMGRDVGTLVRGDILDR